MFIYIYDNSLVKQELDLKLFNKERIYYIHNSHNPGVSFAYCSIVLAKNLKTVS